MELSISFTAVGFVAIALSKGRLLRIRRVPAWRSADPGVATPDRYSAFGYTNVLGNVLGASHVAEVVELPGHHSPQGSDRQRARPGNQSSSSRQRPTFTARLVSPGSLWPASQSVFTQVALTRDVAYMPVARLVVLLAIAVLR